MLTSILKPISTQKWSSLWKEESKPWTTLQPKRTLTQLWELFPPMLKADIWLTPNQNWLNFKCKTIISIPNHRIFQKPGIYLGSATSIVQLALYPRGCQSTIMKTSKTEWWEINTMKWRAILWKKRVNLMMLINWRNTRIRFWEWCRRARAYLANWIDIARIWWRTRSKWDTS